MSSGIRRRQGLSVVARCERSSALAQTLSAGDEASVMTLLGAAVGCGMQMPGGP